jgi:hypothetical protein
MKVALILLNTVRPGVVQKSNTLELMRLVGLDVRGETGT